MEEILISAGIDIGTSTTQLVFSRLKIQNLASDFSVPRIEITDKEIIYRSRIYMTPLTDSDVIDGEGVRRILEKEYAASGIKKEQISTGAVIITGETARKRNARDIVMACSEFAGDFVVATAGPDLESIISGKGAGADIYSKEHHTSIVHLDIGGGTSNLSVFASGTAMDSGCLDIGGRILKVDAQQRIIYISEKLKQLIARHGWPVATGMKADRDMLAPLLEKLTGILEMSAGLKEKDADYDLMVTEHGLEKAIQTECISFSGGVAEYIYRPQGDQPDFAYGDIGILLGQTIRQSALFHTKTIYESQEKIRATVVGAGSHTTKISGSTVVADKSVLPVKNIPIVKIELHEEFKHTETDNTINVKGITEAILRKNKWYFQASSETGGKMLTGIALNGLPAPSYAQVCQYADAILQAIAREPHRLSDASALVVITKEDMGKVLGQCLRAGAGSTYPVICLDGIELSQGDYIDIGLPVMGGMIVPVVVKTLVFR